MVSGGQSPGRKNQTIGGDVDISTAVVPEFDITYFFTENWSAELILATTKHDVTALGTAAGDIDLGHVWLLPPTLTMQYHFNGELLRPYLGAGINYTLFYNVDEGPVADDVDYDNALGFAFQLGCDIDLNEKWFIKAIKSITSKNIPVVNVTQCSGGSVDMSLYHTNKEYKNIGIISGKDITTEAAIAKLMFMLGQNISANSFKTKFESSLRGEMK